MLNDKVCGNAVSPRGRHMTSCCCLDEDGDTQRLCLPTPDWPVSRWPHFQKSHLWRLSHKTNSELVCKRHICARGDGFETTGVCLEAWAALMRTKRVTTNSSKWAVCSLRNPTAGGDLNGVPQVEIGRTIKIKNKKITPWNHKRGVRPGPECSRRHRPAAITSDLTGLAGSQSQMWGLACLHFALPWRCSRPGRPLRHRVSHAGWTHVTCSDCFIDIDYYFILATMLMQSFHTPYQVWSKINI